MVPASSQHVCAAVSARYREAVWLRTPDGRTFRSVVSPSLEAAAVEGAEARVHLTDDGRLAGWSASSGGGVDQRSWDGPLAGFTRLRCAGSCERTWDAPAGPGPSQGVDTRCLACGGPLLADLPAVGWTPSLRSRARN